MSPEMRHRGLPEFRTSREPEEGVWCRPDDGDQEEDSRGERGEGVGHRHRAAEEDAEERRALEEAPPAAGDDPSGRGGEEGKAPRAVGERRSRCMMAQNAQADLKESVLQALSKVTHPQLYKPINGRRSEQNHPRA